MISTIKYRHEIKVNINSFDKEILKNRLSHVLKKDKHTGRNGYYTVRSIYFDDQNNNAVNEKLMGVKYREKFRIRTYDNSTLIIRLEKKVKNNTVCYKETALLSLKECQELINGDCRFLLNRPEMVCKQLYTKMRTGLFKPKAIIEYKREAFIWEPGRIRITIDSDIKTGISSVDFFNSEASMTAVADNSTSILEIKYDNYLPSHINNLVMLDNRQRASISKYVLGRRFG